jgi:hypothetical protein
LYGGVEGLRSSIAKRPGKIKGPADFLPGGGRDRFERNFDTIAEPEIPCRSDGAAMATHGISDLAWERMVTAVEKVRDRLRRAAEALERANISYAIVGGNAVAAWVAEVDEAAVRNTQDVDIMLRRDDLDRAKDALAQAGFTYRHAASIDMFLDGPNAKARDAVHVVFAGEKVRAEYAFPAPDVDEVKTIATRRILDLESLLRMKLTSFRDKDRTHVRDLIGVGLVDASWTARLPPGLATRLQTLLDDPDG